MDRSSLADLDGSQWIQKMRKWVSHWVMERVNEWEWVARLPCHRWVISFNLRNPYGFNRRPATYNLETKFVQFGSMEGPEWLENRGHERWRVAGWVRKLCHQKLLNLDNSTSHSGLPENGSPPGTDAWMKEFCADDVPSRENSFTSWVTHTIDNAS